MERDEKKKNGFPNLLGRQSKDDEHVSTPPKPSVREVKHGASGDDWDAEDEDPSFESSLENPDDMEMEDSDEFDDDYGYDLEDEVTNYVSAELSEQDKRDIYEAMDVIRRKLSFVKDFSKEERANMMRLGKSGRSFVEKAQNLVQRDPGILPRSFDLGEFIRDAELYQELGNIADELEKLFERVSDTEAAVGSDAFSAALVVYQSGKLARTGDDMDNQLGGWRRRKSED